MMPIARFQLEDGRIARFEVPEGTTADQAQVMMSEYIANQGAQSRPVQEEQSLEPSDKSLISKVGGTLSAIPEMFTGSERKTELTERLPELQESGILAGENQAKVAAISPALLTSINPNEIAKIITSNFPNVGVTYNKDGKGKVFPVLVNNETGAATVINKPGMSGLDVLQGLGMAAALTPAASGATATRAGLTQLAAKGAATQTAIEGVQAASGGEFNPTDIAVTAAALPAGQALGEKVLAPTAARAGQAIKESVKGAFRGGEQGRVNLANAIADFAEIGVTPTVGQGTGSPLRQGLENMSSRVLGGGRIKEVVRRTAEQMRGRLQEVADRLSTTSGATDVGRVIRAGITGPGGFIERFNARQGLLWREVDDIVGDAASSDISNTSRVLGNLVRDDAFGAALNNPVLARVRDVIGRTIGQTRINNVTQMRETVSTIPYSDLRSLRSQIGEMLSSRDLVSDIPRAQLKRLYGALSEDVRQVARQAGAISQFNRANNFTRAGHNRIDDFLQPLVNKSDLSKITQAVARGGEGKQTLNAIKRSLTPEQWQEVSSHVIRNLGRASSGQQGAEGVNFSVAKFLTDWDKLGPSRKILFSGSRELNNYSNNLNRIARAAERFKEAAKEMANPSGTGQFTANVGAVSGGAASLATGNLPAFGVIMGLISANKGASTLMTNPRFVQWLASTTQSNLSTQIPKLTAIAANQGLEVEIDQLIGDLSQSGLNQAESKVE